MRSLRLNVDNGRGQGLAALLDMPVEREIRCYALFAHCFTCHKNYKIARSIGRTLAAHGIAMLRFDFTGLGDSEGEFADSNFTTNVSDVLACADYLDVHYQAPRLLIGHSLGGSAVLCAAGGIDKSRAVVTINTPDEPAHLLKFLVPRFEAAQRDGRAEIAIGGVSWPISRQLLDDLRFEGMSKVIAELGRALLVIHVPQDDTVDISNASRIFATARHPKSYVAVDGADHLLAKNQDAVYAGNVIAAWASRFITP